MKISIGELAEVLSIARGVLVRQQSAAQAEGGAETDDDSDALDTLADAITVRFDMIEQRLGILEAKAAVTAQTKPRRAGRPRKSAASKSNGAQPAEHVPTTA